MANMLGFVALGVSGASVFCALLALALPYWVSGEILGISSHSGLFRYCFRTCGNVLDLPGLNDSLKSSYRATQAMVLLGFFELVGSVVVLVLLLFIMKGRNMLGYIAGGLAIGGGFFLMIGFGIYSNKINSAGTDYGSGFAFDILGWLAAWVAGGIIFFMTFSGALPES